MLVYLFHSIYVLDAGVPFYVLYVVDAVVPVLHLVCCRCWCTCFTSCRTIRWPFMHCCLVVVEAGWQIGLSYMRVQLLRYLHIVLLPALWSDKCVCLLIHTHCHTNPFKRIVMAIYHHQTDCLFYYGNVSDLVICNHSNIQLIYVGMVKTEYEWQCQLFI